MSETIEFYYDFISPPTYIAYKRLPELVAKYGLRIDYKPVLLGGIHKAVEHKAAVSQAPSKIRWMYRDLKRTAERHSIPFGPNANFPFLTIAAMRGALVAKDLGQLDTFNAAFFDAMWRDGKNISDSEVMMALLDQAGCDSKFFAERIQAPEIKERLKLETATAVKKGVFGCPTFIVKDELVFGQDRIDVVEEILSES